jgi:hypothetical protein
MNVKAPSLPVVFVGALLLSAAAIFGYEFSSVGSELLPRMLASPDTFVYFGLAIVVAATLVAFVTMIVREYRRAQRPETSDYRQALKTGQISGDVSRWQDWIRHDRRVNAWWVGGVAWFVFWGGVEVINGRWVNLWMFAVGAYAGWRFWDTRRRLKVLAANLSA